MKKFCFTIVIVLLSASCFAQQHNPFLGTWHYQDGNNVFVVSLWEDDEDVMLGHYKMITIDSQGQQTGLVYNSKKSLRGNSLEQWPYSIYSGPYEGGNVEGG